MIEAKRKEQVTDKHIAYVAVDKLRGQAQIDFIMDYFEEIRRKTREEARKEFLDILAKELNNYTLVLMGHDIDDSENMKELFRKIKQSLSEGEKTA